MPKLVGGMPLPDFAEIKRDQIADFFGTSRETVEIETPVISAASRRDRKKGERLVRVEGAGGNRQKMDSMKLAVAAEIKIDDEGSSSSALAEIHSSLQSYLGATITFPVVTCGAGFTREKADGECQVCPSGFYKSELDDVACTACQSIEMESPPGSADAFNCTCRSGYEL